MGTGSELQLSNTSLPTLTINEHDLYDKYKYVGHGGEGTVYRYDEKTVFKIFNGSLEGEKLSMKFRKIEVLGHMSDEDVILPKGLVGISVEDHLDVSSLDTSDYVSFTKQVLGLKSEEVLKAGFFMDGVDCHPEYKNFDRLRFLKDTKKAVEIIQKADTIMRRLHQKGFRIGDVKGSNILIDKDLNPKFIDGDNMAYKEFPYDLVDIRTTLLDETFGGKHSRKDSDIYLFTLLCLNYFMANAGKYLGYNKKYLQKLVEFLKVDPATREALAIILSDANDKPYVGEVLEHIGQEAFVFTKRENMVLTHNLI